MKKILKITGIVCFVLVGILLALYFYVINNAESLIKDMVTKQSHGKLSLVVKKIEFNPRKLHLEVIQPHFYSTDTTTSFTTYDIRANKLVLELSALRPLLFDRKIYLDTIVFMRPQVTITKWKDQPKENFSLPEQMGKVYAELNNLLNTLNIKYCLIDSGRLTLENKIQKNSTPIIITDYYLRIDNLKIDSTSENTDRYLFSDRIRFYSSHQDIAFPDGNHRLKYGRLRINSLKKSIEIDSCYIYGKKSGDGFNEFGFFFDTLRLSNVNFEKLTRMNTIEADSALCINPELRINMELTESSKKNSTKRVPLSKDSMAMAVKTLFGDIDINYIGVLNARLAMQTKSHDKITSFSTRQSNFIMQDITIVKDPGIPIKVGSFYFGLHGYKTYDHDSSYMVSFDSILFRNNRINLSNFAISPTAKNKNFTDRKDIRMHALEIQHLAWLDLITNKNIVAGEVTMNRPEINITAPERKQGSNTVSHSIYEAFNEFADKLQIGRLKIEDANINFYAANKNHLLLQKVNTVIGFDHLLRSTNINDLAGSLNMISFANGTLHAGANFIKLQNGIFNGKEHSLFISSASVFEGKGKNAAIIKNIQIDNFHASQLNQFEIGSLSWENANIIYNASANKKNINPSGKSSVQNKPLQLALAKLNGKNTTVSIQSNNLHANIIIDKLEANSIYWDGKNKPVIQGLQVKGNTLHLKNSSLDVDVKEFLIKDQQPSYLHQLSILSKGKKNTISINNTNLSFIPDIGSILAGNSKISDVVLNNPIISIINSNRAVEELAEQKKGKLPRLNINQISILNPVITNLPPSTQHKINVAEHASNWYVKDIRSNDNLLTIKGIKSSITGFSAETNTVAFSVQEQGKLDVDVTGITFIPASNTTAARWSATLNAVSARNIKVTTKKNDSVKNNIQLYSLDAENLKLNNVEKITAGNMLAGNKNFRIKNTSFNILTPQNNVRVNNLQFDNSVKTISLDSMAFAPLIDRDSFNRINIYQKDYMQFSTGKTFIYGINPELFFKDTIIFLKKIETNQAMLRVYKDKRLPANKSSYKPLPVTAIQQISKKISVDSIQVKNADISYEELNEKTLMTGIVKFKRTDALIQNFKTFDIKPTDSLRLYVTSWAMDTIFLKLRFNESYMDTLNGFLFGVRLSPFNMTALNPILQPLVSAKINRGWMDTLTLTAIGREYIAYGKMKMYYSNLKATYLKNGNEEVKTFKTKLITFFANNLVLRHNNQKGFGQVYAERMRDKSLFNYWLKILISGAISNTGVKTNKKLEKKYHQSIKKKKLPEIEEVEL